jgi:hypothetical protein
MALKSSWELALARTGGQSEKRLTDKQKAALSELDRVYTAKIAERELELKPKIAAANAKGDAEAAQKFDQILRNEVAKLRAKLNDEKEKVRQGK